MPRRSLGKQPKKKSKKKTAKRKRVAKETTVDDSTEKATAPSVASPPEKTTPITPSQDHTTTPTCVGIRPGGKVCGNPDVRSQKFQLCNTCYTRAIRKKELQALKIFKTQRHRKTGPNKPRTPQPRFEAELSEKDSLDTTKTFSYGKFDTRDMQPWEKAFVFSRKKDVVEHFDDPASKGIAHRWVLAELMLERQRRKAMEYQSNEESAKLDKALGQIDKMEKMVQSLQKELNFLPSQTLEEKKIEEVFSNMYDDYRNHKTHYVAGFDEEEIQLMLKKKMDVPLENKRLSEITGRLARERARAIKRIMVDSCMDVCRDVFGLDDAQVEDLLERWLMRVKTKAPAIKGLID